MASFDGLGLHLGNLSRLSNAQTRSLSAENPSGAKSGGGRAQPPAGSTNRTRGWKVLPCIGINPGDTATIADVSGPGAIQQIWMTTAGAANRSAILRIYWDGQAQPSVECPIGDFFASAYTSFDVFAQLNSLAVCVNPGNAFNCYWEMPFRKHCRITLENRHASKEFVIFYQINYTLTQVPDDAAYFHAQFRRVNPLPYGDVAVLLDGVQGQGHYVGTYLAWQVNNNGWWGEGEIKFYLDGDAAPEISDGEVVGGSTGFPTICGTGTEDYFCGSYNFENKQTKSYQEFSTPYAGMPHVVRPDGTYGANTRFSLYRWHILDPIRFQQDLKVTQQALGWRENGRFLPLQDDIASVAYWYQTLPTAPFPKLPNHDFLEII